MKVVGKKQIVEKILNDELFEVSEETKELENSWEFSKEADNNRDNQTS